ncbi:MAG: hypothetical protein QXK37_05415 [Candidatus Woesearchaeota archaeon]
MEVIKGVLKRKLYLASLILIFIVGTISVYGQSAPNFCIDADDCNDGNDCTQDICNTKILFLDGGTIEIEFDTCSWNALDRTPCGFGGVCDDGVCKKRHGSGGSGKKTTTETTSETSEQTNPQNDGLENSEPENDGSNGSVPEFSTIAAALAFGGASVGYLLLRRLN